jgi:hypothetical protein
MEDATFSPAKITIDLKEYLFLQNKIESEKTTTLTDKEISDCVNVCIQHVLNSINPTSAPKNHIEYFNNTNERKLFIEVTFNPTSHQNSFKFIKK